MAGISLSTDIFSPIKSEFSISDGSALSFECSSNTPDFEKHLKIFGKEPHLKGSSFKFFAENATNEKEASFEMILNDVKRQSDINAEKEEKFKSTFEQLKQSMDDLFESKMPDSDVPSAVTKQLDLENIHNTENISGLKTEKEEEVENPKAATKMCGASTRECSKTFIRKSQENASKTVKNRKNDNQDKNFSQSKKSVETSRNKENVRNKNNVKSKDVRQQSSKLKVSEISSSSHTSETKKDKKEAQSLRSRFGNQKKDIPISVPNIENKVLSLEKSIEIAISMQFDGIRSLLLDQHICLQKEMLLLQEKARQQNEVNKYLFSVVEELLEANKKLISKRA